MTYHSPLLRRIAILLTLVILAASCGFASQTPKSIVLIIGDGMGIGAITAARCAGPGPDGRLVMDSMPVTGFLLTHSANALVTDSAAAATALATGVKTNNGMISMTPDGARLRTILEVARELGKSTGVVTTDGLVAATPAAFYAHVHNRGQGDDIAAQVVPSRINVAFGGGRGSFVSKTETEGGRADGRDMLAEARKRGYDVVGNAEEMHESKSDRIIGLFAESSNPSLADMTAKAIAVLSRNPHGFFLTIEHSWPDKGGHGNNRDQVVKGVLELDAALRKALDFAESDDQTLIVVTADHETGGLAVQNPDDKNPFFKPQWTGGGHTGNMVALYAFGPGSERFSGTHDNTDIPRIFAEFWDAKLN